MLDEVQMLADFEEVLNSLLHIENVDICDREQFKSKDIIIKWFPTGGRNTFDGKYYL